MEKIINFSINFELFSFIRIFVLAKSYHCNTMEGTSSKNTKSSQLRVGGTPERPTVFDVLRRRYVALTPEEWVRQQFVHFLINEKGYPQTLLANEVRLQVGNKTLRADTVLYDTQLHPRMIIEYKAPTIALTQKVFDQISTYNLLLHVDYLVVSNGQEYHCCRMNYEQQTYEFLTEIPTYEEM